jgi:hypothetical protein
MSVRDHLTVRHTLMPLAPSGRHAETETAAANLHSVDRLFWTALRQCWSRWTDVLVLVKPDTVIGWHRAGFRLYWRWRSRPRGGRPKITEEIRALIQRLAHGAPRRSTESFRNSVSSFRGGVWRGIYDVRRSGEPARVG